MKLIAENSRNLFLAILLSSIALLSYALYTQYIGGLSPCPLCLTQRVFFIAISAMALAAVAHNSKTLAQRIYGFMILLFSLVGAIVAGRQVWLQSLPEDQIPACGPDLAYILEAFPLIEAIKVLFAGDGNCAEVVWTFLSLSMPSWSLLWFIGYGVAGLLLALSAQPRLSHNT